MGGVEDGEGGTVAIMGQFIVRLARRMPIVVILISRKARCRGGQPLVSEGALPVGLGVLAETGGGVHACGSAAKEEVEHRRFAAVGAAEERQMDRIAHEPA